VKAVTSALRREIQYILEALDIGSFRLRPFPFGKRGRRGTVNDFIDVMQYLTVSGLIQAQIRLLEIPLDDSNPGTIVRLYLEPIQQL
jgi:hypothetical protein